MLVVEEELVVDELLEVVELEAVDELAVVLVELKTGEVVVVVGAAAAVVAATAVVAVLVAGGVAVIVFVTVTVWVGPELAAWPGGRQRRGSCCGSRRPSLRGHDSRGSGGACSHGTRSCGA